MYITRDFQQVPHQQHVFLLYHINDLRFHWILTSKWFQSSYTALIQVIWTLNYCFEGFTDWQWGQFGEWGVTRQTGDELKLRYKCEYVVIVEKVPHVGEKVQEEKKDAKSKPHTLLSKTCSAWQEKEDRMTSLRLTLLPSPEPSTPEREPQRDPRTQGVAEAPPPLGKAQTQQWSASSRRSPPTGIPLLGPLLWSCLTGIPGGLWSSTTENLYEKKRKEFSLLWPYFPSVISSWDRDSYLCFSSFI